MNKFLFILITFLSLSPLSIFGSYMPEGHQDNLLIFSHKAQKPVPVIHKAN